MHRLFDLAGPARRTDLDRALGALLAFVAGATNAGGFLAVGQYTSHMTGLVSAMADDVALGQPHLALVALAAVVAFTGGAMTTAITVNWARRRGLGGRFALPLLFEAVLLLAFGTLGGALARDTTFVAPATVLVLCFLMGLQNAVITKVSQAEIRTTHVTGLVTDIGIELGRMLYVNLDARGVPVRADRGRLRVQLLLLGSFAGGGLVGALGFKAIGYVMTIPLAGLLGVVAAKPLAHDLRQRR